MDVVFGCETKETGEIYNQEADGILGLGNSEVSMVNQVSCISDQSWFQRRALHMQTEGWTQVQHVCGNYGREVVLAICVHSAPVKDSQGD